MNWVAMLEWVATWKYLMGKSKFMWEREGLSRCFLHPRGSVGGSAANSVSDKRGFPSLPPKHEH